LTPSHRNQTGSDIVSKDKWNSQQRELLPIFTAFPIKPLRAPMQRRSYVKKYDYPKEKFKIIFFLINNQFVACASPALRLFLQNSFAHEILDIPQGCIGRNFCNLFRRITNIRRIICGN